jgi:hypothetical protein
MRRVSFPDIRTGCGLPFMLVRGGIDAAVGRPTDPTGRGGCGYYDHVVYPARKGPDPNDPNSFAEGAVQGLVELIVEPLFDPVPALLVASWCGDTATCDGGGASPVKYFKDQALPDSCKEFAEQQEARRAEQEKEAKEEAERERKEAVEALLRESPVQSEQGLNHDPELVGELTPAQQEAMRDAANHVVLTKDEEQALRSISLDQWHAVSQLAAFYKWLNDKFQEAQAQNEKQQEQTEREQENARLAVYQSLMVDAATRQAAAAEWQAAALWRQQQCLRNLTAGLQCY